MARCGLGAIRLAVDVMEGGGGTARESEIGGRETAGLGSAALMSSG